MRNAKKRVKVNSATGKESESSVQWCVAQWANAHEKDHDQNDADQSGIRHWTFLYLVYSSTSLSKREQMRHVGRISFFRRRERTTNIYFNFFVNVNDITDTVLTLHWHWTDAALTRPTWTLTDIANAMASSELRISHTPFDKMRNLRKKKRYLFFMRH